MDKIEDFGVHANAYYSLKVETYKTKLDEQLLDLLWNKYWIATLSQSLLVSVREPSHTSLIGAERNSAESPICNISDQRPCFQIEIRV